MAYVSELSSFMSRGSYPTCVQRINHPIHKGAPNPAHGKFFFVGSIPGECYDREAGRSRLYDTEEQAIRAAIAAGAKRIQGTDCRFIDVADYR